MRKQNGPAIPDPFVKVDGALRSFRREIRRFVVDTQHARSPCDRHLSRLDDSSDLTRTALGPGNSEKFKPIRRATQTALQNAVCARGLYGLTSCGSPQL